MVIGSAVGGTVGGTGIIIVIAFIVVIRRRKNKKNTESEEIPMKSPSRNTDPEVQRNSVAQRGSSAPAITLLKDVELKRKIGGEGKT